MEEATMPLPHDVADLQLAPVALALNEELGMLSPLGGAELERHILIAANRSTGDLAERAERERLLVHVVTRAVDLHGWEVSCDPRGLRMTHGGHTLVLGLSRAMHQFLADDPA
jgi:hypothetical protein